MKKQTKKSRHFLAQNFRFSFADQDFATMAQTLEPTVLAQFANGYEITTVRLIIDKPMFMKMLIDWFGAHDAHKENKAVWVHCEGAFQIVAFENSLPKSHWDGPKMPFATVHDYCLQIGK